MSAPTQVEVFAALGDPTRQELLGLLAAAERAPAAALAAPLAITRQAVEKHLGVLERAGLVRTERSGRRVSYAVRTEALAESAAWLQDLAAAWDRRLTAVKAAAEAATEPSRRNRVQTPSRRRWRR